MKLTVCANHWRRCVLRGDECEGRRSLPVSGVFGCRIAPLFVRLRPCGLRLEVSTMQTCVVCGRCRASILAGLPLMQGFASPLRSPGTSFSSAVIFRSFARSGFTASPSNSLLTCASGCGFPCAPASPADRPAVMDARHRPVSQNM